MSSFPSNRDFALLKSMVTIEQVLQYFGLMDRLVRHGPNRLVGPCPIHSGADNPSAFVVSLDHQLWRCFTGCAQGGDIVALARLVGNLSYCETAELLATLAQLPSRHPQELKKSKSQSTASFSPFTKHLNLAPCHPFLQKMALLTSTAQYFEAGYYSGAKGFLAGCLGVRLHNLHGDPLGYIGRHLDPCEIDKWGKWKLSRSFPKTTIFYNYHRACRHMNGPILVVEGVWGVMKLYQAGFPACLALLGCSISALQKRLLLSGWHTILLLLDGDIPGQTAAHQLYHELAPKAKIIHINADPEDLSEQQLRHILQPYFR